MPDSADNPFNPGYGVEPPRLAGRAAVHHEILLGLQRGPGRHGYHHVLVGGRGTGKTVLLQRLREYVETEWRWTTIAWQGRRDWPLQQVLTEEETRVERELTSRLRRAGRAIRPDTITASVPSVASVRKNLDSRRTYELSITALLRRYGQWAATAHRALVLVVDELQNARSIDLAALSGSIQLVSNQERLPIALIAAGLSNTKAKLRAAHATYIERQDTTVIGNLDDEATRDALETPILDAGRSISAAALDLLVTASEGYPYAIQLVGKHAWDAAGDHQLITREHARRGAARAQRALADNLHGDRWEQLADRERQYLLAAIELTGVDGASTAEIAERLGGTLQSMSRTRDSLINRHHVLRAGRTGYVIVDIPGLADWVTQHQTQQRQTGPQQPPDHRAQSRTSRRHGRSL